MAHYKLSKFTCTITAILLNGLLSFSLSQTVDDIIDKYDAAIGGLDKINSIQTVKITAKTTRRDNDVPLIEYIKKPDKIRTEITMQGQTMIRAYDGTIGWGISPFRGNKDAEKMNEEETNGMKEMVQFEGPLVNNKDKGSTAELLGKDDYEGTSVFKIKLTTKTGNIHTFYIDDNSYLLLKEDRKLTIREKEINIERIYGDYRSEDGYIMAHSIESKSGGERGGSQKVLVEKVEFNISIDDSIFSMPEGK